MGEEAEEGVATELADSDASSTETVIDKKAYSPHWSLAGLIEANMNAPEKYSVGSGLYGLFSLPDVLKHGQFLLGLKSLYSYNPDKYHLFNTAFLFRWTYDFSGKYADSGLFIQPEVGFALAWNGENKAAKPFAFALGQLNFGYRYTYKNFFIEPYVYGGYPALWGIGIAIGGGK